VDAEKEESGASCKITFKQWIVSGHDFSRAESATRSYWALAPAVLVFSYL
jgi:hypothetical protein